MEDAPPQTPEAFARERHAGQLRTGTDIPYLVHPAGVAAILARHYPGRDDLEAAGWLHDTLEDTATTSGELKARFGREVRRLVEAVTNGWRQVFHVRPDRDSVRLKAADALDNVTFTIAELRRGEVVWDRFRDGRRKVGYWRQIADITTHRLGSEQLATDLRGAVTELEALAAEPDTARPAGG